MRTSTLFCFSLLCVAGASFAQARTAPPAQTAPAARRPAPAPAAPRSGIAMTVTDAHGLPIPDVRVTVAGPSDRSGETDDNGQVNFVGMQPGTYRARFDGDKVVSFEREVVVRAGQPTGVEVTLNLTPPAAAPPPAPAPASTAVQPATPRLGPAGQPGVSSVLDLLEKQFIGKQPRREALIACTGNTRTMLIQMNEPLPDRVYDAADVEYYVVGGEGTARLAGREMPVASSSVVSVPRNTLHSFTRKGNRPLILLSILTGEPCEQPK